MTEHQTGSERLEGEDDVMSSDQSARESEREALADERESLADEREVLRGRAGGARGRAATLPLTTGNGPGRTRSPSRGPRGKQRRPQRTSAAHSGRRGRA